MKIVLMSDSHSRHKNINVLKSGVDIENIETLNLICGGVILPEQADVIIHAGDVSLQGSKNEVEDFLNWYSSLPYKYKILISGNHDFLFEKTPAIAKELLTKYPDIIYLESSEIIIEGIKFYGEPRQPWFHNWAFNVQRGPDIKKYWDAIPDDVDVLITHGPPKGILDTTARGQQAGCEDLLARVWELKNLKLFVCGHIHEHAGYENINGVHFVNASVLNLRYQLQNLPQIFEVDENKNFIRL